MQRRVRSNLPVGGIEVVANVAADPTKSTADIWITWQEPGVIVAAEGNADNCSANASALATLPRCFYMRVQL
jgi:type IV pilus assembly protein PilV